MSCDHTSLPGLSCRARRSRDRLLTREQQVADDQRRRVRAGALPRDSDRRSATHRCIPTPSFPVERVERRDRFLLRPAHHRQQPSGPVHRVETVAFDDDRRVSFAEGAAPQPLRAAGRPAAASPEASTMKFRRGPPHCGQRRIRRSAQLRHARTIVDSAFSRGTTAALLSCAMDHLQPQNAQ